MNENRLLSPDQAAVYLGLGSRWAIYRLIAKGQIPAIRLASKLRIDREDLNGLILGLKTSRLAVHPTGHKFAVSRPPATLAPLGRGSSRRPVTMPVTATEGARKVRETHPLSMSAKGTPQWRSDVRPRLDTTPRESS